jgi:hypothetical protein
MYHAPYRRPTRRPTATTLLASAALAATLALGATTVATHRGPTPTPAPSVALAAPAPTWGPHGTAFGTLPSSGDSVLDCGEMADHDNDLPPAAARTLAHCLDLHGWTYDD